MWALFSPADMLASTRQSLQTVCMALSILLLVAVIAAVILNTDWIEDTSSLLSLSTVRSIKPVPKMLSVFLQNPQGLPVIFHGKVRVEESKPLAYSLLVLVDSQPESYAQRMAIRNTWMSYPSAGVNVAVLFTVAEKNLKLEALKELSEESAMYQDMVVFRGVSAHPEGEKLLYQLLWAEQNMHYTNLLKTKDSFYVRLEELLHDVRRLKTNSKVYWGYFEGHTQPRGGSKYPEPEWFLCNKFVRYAHSGGYVLSHALVKRLLEQAEYLHLYNNEDVALSTWLSPYSDVYLKHDIRFDTEVGNSRGCNNNLLVFPVENSLLMVEQHRRLLASGKVCETEVEHMESHDFDFNVPVDKCCTLL